MAAIITSSATATTMLKAYLQHDVAPVLSDAEVTALLERWAIATIWVTETTYVYGQYIVPSDGEPAYLYRVGENSDGTWGGTTGTSEPDWTAGSATDGTVTWEYVSVAPPCIWDLRSAAREGWLMKAAKSAACVDINDGSMRAAQSAIYDHCMRMADRYLPIGVV